MHHQKLKTLNIYMAPRTSKNIFLYKKKFNDIIKIITVATM